MLQLHIVYSDGTTNSIVTAIHNRPPYTGNASDGRQMQICGTHTSEAKCQPVVGLGCLILLRNQQ